MATELEQIQFAAERLGEQFDAVIVIAIRQDAEGLSMLDVGVGNLFARQTMASIVAAKYNNAVTMMANSYLGKSNNGQG